MDPDDNKLLLTHWMAERALVIVGFELRDNSTFQRIASKGDTQWRLVFQTK